MEVENAPARGIILMDANKRKSQQRRRRHRRVRKKVFGLAERPRMCVFRSSKHIYVQLVDDAQGRTLASASSIKLGDIKADDKLGRKSAAARQVGERIAEAAKQHGIQKVIFDRGGYRYHGRIAALAEGARSGGLKF